MQSVEVYQYINGLLRKRSGAFSERHKEAQNLNRTFKADDFDIHVVAGHSECLQILKDKTFAQPRIVEAIGAISRSLNIELGAIEDFLLGNPIAMDGSSHAGCRQSFLKHYSSMQRPLSDTLPGIARDAFSDFIEGNRSRILPDLVEPYIDAVVEVALNSRQNNSSPVRRTSWAGNSSCVFEYVHSATKLKSKAAQLSRLAQQLGLRTDGADEAEIRLGAVLLTYVLQGRDPLLGALSNYMHSLLAMNNEERDSSIRSIDARELFWRTSPVNYIGRVATKAATVGSVHVRAGDHVVLMLPWANHDMHASARNSLAFGAGPHVCAGQALALAIADAWISELRRQHHRINWEGILTDQTTPAVFLQYRTQN